MINNIYLFNNTLYKKENNKLIVLKENCSHSKEHIKKRDEILEQLKQQLKEAESINRSIIEKE